MRGYHTLATARRIRWYGCGVPKAPNPAYEARLEARENALASACVHAGEQPNEWNALATPIVLASAFSFDDAAHAAAAFRGESDAYIYGRWGNPTVEALEGKLARARERSTPRARRRAEWPRSSGALLSICESGSHVVAPRSMYGESARLLRERLPKLGIETTFVDDPTPEAYVAAARPTTRVFYIESPSNPTLAVTDVRAVASAARARGLETIADNTFATPFCQTPLDLGVDLVVHSMTKALGGHGDAIGGAIAGSEEDVARARDTVVKGFGGVMAPLTAYLVARGMRHLRAAPAPRVLHGRAARAGALRAPRDRARASPVARARAQPSTCTRSASLLSFELAAVNRRSRAGARSSNA